MEQLALILLQLLSAVAKVAGLIKLRADGADVTPEMIAEAEGDAKTATDAWEVEYQRLRNVAAGRPPP